MRALIPLLLLSTLSLLLLPSEGSLHSKDLCEVEGCSCTEDRLELFCKCPHKEVIRIGDSLGSAGVSSLPESIRKLVIEECHHVELMTNALNRLPYIRNVTLNKAHSIVIHPRVFNSRQSRIGAFLPLENFVISNVRNLEVRRHSFEGIEVYGTFSLNNVLIKSVPSLSFSFDFVNEFEIIGSRLHRISMWGIKLPKCHEFRSTEKTTFLSLSSHALFMSCQNFILIHNTFGSLHDASLNVSYRYAEIRKNTFETITGKPFINLRHQSDGGSFIFRENKFHVDSSLPEEALSMPEFGALVDFYIDNNHFVCDCEKLAWLLYAADDAAHSEDIPSSDFLRELVNTSGKCLICDGRRCTLGEEDFIAFLQSTQVTKVSEGYDCSKRPEAETTRITEASFKITETPANEDEEEFKENEEVLVQMTDVKNIMSKPESKSPPEYDYDEEYDESLEDEYDETEKDNHSTGQGSNVHPSVLVFTILIVVILNTIKQ